MSRLGQTKTDEQLMTLAANGDKEAFTELYGRYKKNIYYFFLKMLWQNAQLAADFTQELFFKLIRNANTYNVNQPFKPWVYSVAHNMCKNEYKKQEIRKRFESQTANETLLEINLSSQNQVKKMEMFRETLLLKLESFPIDKKEAFIMRYLENLSIKEISEIQEKPEGSIKSGLHYTCKKLATWLAPFKTLLYEKE